MLSYSVSDDPAEICVTGFNAVVDRVRDFLVRDGILDSNTFFRRAFKEQYRTTILKLEIVSSLSSVLTVMCHIPKESLIFSRNHVDLKTVYQIRERIVHTCGEVIKVNDSQSVIRKKIGDRSLNVSLRFSMRETFRSVLLYGNRILRCLMGKRILPFMIRMYVRLKSFKDVVSGNFTESSVIEFDSGDDRWRAVREW